MTREASQGVQVTALHVVSAAGTIVQPLDFSVDAGKTLAVIGESGSGLPGPGVLEERVAQPGEKVCPPT